MRSWEHIIQKLLEFFVFSVSEKRQDFENYLKKKTNDIKKQIFFH